MAERYGMSREDAAALLSVSTRTIDRYVKSWKLSYKKVANKMLLNPDEIAELKKDFDLLHQNPSSEIVSEREEVRQIIWNAKETTSWQMSTEKMSSLNQMIDEKIDKFFLIFQEKDRMLEEKNKIIFMLQQRVGELETKIQWMIALPDHNEEKHKAILEKEKLQEKLSQVNDAMRGEKTKSFVYLAVFVVVILFMVFRYAMTQ